jgi:two-component system, OmpR family, alkaline phosphatase synthesis response regulator PhoP
MRSQSGTDPGVRRGAERRQMKRKHVFAVNGSPAFLNVVRELLQDERYNVTTTNYVPHTFDQIAALEPDLLLVDLATGRRAGWDLLERLHAAAATRGVPVLITSTDPHLLVEAEALAARYGGDRFMVKPFDLDVLLAAVQTLIGSA